jgi:SAM-dependent methyltransferase
MFAHNNGSAARTSCPVCSSSELLPCIEIENVPVHCNVVWSSRELAVQAPLGKISLKYCTACGHLFNTAFNFALMRYMEGYENSLHFSPSFQTYATSLAEELIARYDVRDKTVIEIGCGKGEFLELLSELGNNRGIGFDPSYLSEPRSNGSSQRLTFIQDFYSEGYAHFQADLICCRHVLEHIQQPVEFLTSIRRAIDGKRGVVVFFEVPNALATLHDLAIWDLIYEHCSYFSRYSLKRALRNGGFEVCRLEEAFGKQFLVIESAPGECSGDFETQESDELASLANDVLAFAKNYHVKVEEWRRILKQAELRNKRVVIWGAGSKGVSLLNTLDVTDQIGYAVDINPRKQGMFIARTGQKIVPPEFLRDYRPELVIVMNSLYEAEIRERCQSLDLRSDFLCA